MDKGEILKNLNEIQFSLNDAKTKLKNVLNQNIWDQFVADELDGVVSIKQKIDEHIIEIVNLQRKISIK